MTVTTGIRLEGWPRRLNDYLEAERDRPYAAQHHCLMFVAGGVRAITGVDLARGRKSSTKTLAAQWRHLKRLGFDSPAELIDSLLPSRLPTFARRGDLVMGEDGIPGICIGNRAVFVGSSPDREGLVTVPMSEMTRAWSVGEV